MKIAEALEEVRCIFLDTAPVVYYVERHPTYFERVRPIFERIDDGQLTGVTSPVTLAECLVVPCRLNLSQLRIDFHELIVHGTNTLFMPIGEIIARRAAELRASLGLTLTDAFQAATAMESGCDALLTNDNGMKRVTGLRILIVDDLTT
jgi:predicted nucleic acid-binding protein